MILSEINDMSSKKANLKAARNALVAENYEEAVEYAQLVIDEEPDNYHG
jgi:hypothetical protein